MANPREVRGWTVALVGGSVAYTAFAIRIWAIFALPAWPVPVHESLLALGLVGVVVAAVGLRQALWYYLVAPDGLPMYAAAVLLFAAGVLHLFQIPTQFDSAFMMTLFLAAILEWFALPLLTYRKILALAAVVVLVLVIVLLTSGLAFLPSPFSTAVDAWGWTAIAARILELAALGAAGNMLFLAKEVPPASERTGA